jgi:hypothetical protein
MERLFQMGISKPTANTVSDLRPITRCKPRSSHNNALSPGRVGLHHLNRYFGLLGS